MTLSDDVLLKVLQACAGSAPAPFFPAQQAVQNLDRATVDAALDGLRLAGLVKIDDWVQGKGQGYKITPEGAASLHKGRIVPAKTPEEAAADPMDTPWDRGEDARRAVLEPTPPIVAMSLLFANLFVFVVAIGVAWYAETGVQDYVMKAQNPEFFRHTMLHAAFVIHLQEYWRLISHQFVHANILHIGFNMYALFTLGSILESLWGSKRFLALYLISGWVGGCAVLFTDAGAIGASGAISGLLTSLAVWVWLNRAHLPPQLLSAWTRNIAVNLMLLIWISVSFPRVSWQAHLGGAIGGAVVSFPLHYLRGGSLWKRGLALLGVAAVPAAALVIALTPSWPVIAAQWRFADNLRSLDTWLFEQHEYLMPLARLDGPLDEEFATQARSVIRESESRIDPLIEELQGQLPDDESSLAGEMKQTQAYLAAWKDVLVGLERVLERPEPWHKQRRDELFQRIGTMLQRRQPLLHHQLMPRLDATIRLPAAQPVNRPPANTA